MDLNLQHQHAVITGASRGIGLGIASRLAQEGCRVSLVARSAEALAEAARTLGTITDAVVDTLALDLRQPGSAEVLASRFPDADILVNNAGDIPGGTLEEVDEATWRTAWDLKVFATLNLSRLYFTRMRHRHAAQSLPRGGVILNIIGAAGEMLDAGYICGSVGNAALIAFTKSLGSTSIDHGVRVLGLNPGPVMTDRQRGILQKRAAQRLGDPARWAELEARLPLGRSATVDEIAATTALLCSPLSGYTSGAVLTIDGGLSQRRSIA